ncbi:MAG: hypothetical protein HY823_03720 [Acidobacteria bacterium]|nr:hypothetical protein [Acidobacteriota bacterium]
MWRRLLALAALLALPATWIQVRRMERRRLVPQPRGIVLGLYAGLPDYDYREELDRIAQTGATCVSLQAIYRMETGRSSDILRHPTSSPSEAALMRTFRQARERRLRVLFFPTLNMRDEAENAQWWRGNIRPADWDAWWRAYTEFNVHLASLAQAGGAEWYSVGTEMATTHPFPDRWRALVAEVRKVFRGKVVYSVNFDSHDSFTFGDCLDVIGMNTYDPIAKYDEYPTPDQIRDAWWWIVNKARTLKARFGRPVMITEVGYPSVAHAHVGPWDFRTDKPLDLALQEELVRGAFKVLRNWSDGEAVFYYLYGEHLARKPVGGPLDRTYAPWGKPVEKVLRWYLQEPIFEGHIPPKEQDIHEAVVQSLAAQLRKLRDYEDAVLAPWAERWRVERPGDWAEALAVVEREPRPKKKIGKGRERADE